jgi:transposase
VKKYQGNKKIRTFSCWEQFLCISFGQLTHRESLRDIVVCLQSHKKILYHLGFRSYISRSTVADANERRDWRIYRDLAQILIKEARKLYVNDSDFNLDIDNTIYALDASTIDLCLNIFKWAKFRKAKGAVKLHTLIDLRGNIPTFIDITDGKVHDVNVLDVLEIEKGAYYIMDKAYVDYSRLKRINDAGAFFITRAKKNMKWNRLYSNQADKTTGVRCDQVIKLTGHNASENYPDKLRRVKYYDKETDQYYVFLTNSFNIEARLVADLYKNRWQVEIFFKWVKQHLKIKVFWGRSRNAVKTQIWIAVCTYVLVGIMKRKLKLDKSLYGECQ